MLKALGAGILMIIGGIVLRAHFEPAVQVCDSGFGAFAQALSTTANQDCSTTRDAVAAAPWLIGLGAVISAGSVLMLAGIIGSGGMTSTKKSSKRPAAGRPGTVRPAAGPVRDAEPTGSVGSATSTVRSAAVPLPGAGSGSGSGRPV